MPLPVSCVEKKGLEYAILYDSRYPAPVVADGNEDARPEMAVVIEMTSPGLSNRGALTRMFRKARLMSAGSPSIEEHYRMTGLP